MGSGERERTGVLVLRAWVEGDGDDRLRVRVTGAGPDAGSEVTGSAVSIDGVCVLVRRWLEELLHRRAGDT